MLFRRSPLRPQSLACFLDTITSRSHGRRRRSLCDKNILRSGMMGRFPVFLCRAIIGIKLLPDAGITLLRQCFDGAAKPFQGGRRKL